LKREGDAGDRNAVIRLRPNTNRRCQYQQLAVTGIHQIIGFEVVAVALDDSFAGELSRDWRKRIGWVAAGLWYIAN
jgi:hypothetical protein